MTDIRARSWRWPALGLRHNPFGAPFAFERAELAVPAIDIESVLEHMRSDRAAVEIVGAPGSGKTTHLAVIAERLGGAPIVKIPERTAPIVPELADLLIVDETQRASRQLRRRVFQAARSVVIATHVSFARELAAAGYRTTTLVLRGLGFDGLRSYAERRMSWAYVGPGEPPRVPDAMLRALYARHVGDVRAIERALYAWAEGNGRE